METMDQLQQPSSSSSSSPSPPLSTADRIECNREASKKSLQRNVSLMLETLLAAVDEPQQQQQQQQQNGSGEAVPFDIIASAATVDGSTSDSDVQQQQQQNQQQNNANLIEFLRTAKLRLYEQVDNLVNEVHNSVLVMVTGEGSGTDSSGTGSGTEGTGTGLGTDRSKKTYRKWPRGPLAATPIIPNSNTRTYSKVTRVKNFVPPLPLLCYASTSGTDQQQQSQRKSVIIKTDPYQHSHSHSTSHNYDLTLDDDISVANLIPEVQIDVQEHDNVKMSADLNDGDGDQIDGDGYGDQTYGDQSALDGDNDGCNVAQEMDQREDNNSANLEDSSELVAVDDEHQQPSEQQQQPPKPSSPTELAVPSGLAQRIEQAKADEEERELEEAAQDHRKQPTRRSTRARIVLVNPNADNGEDDDEEEEQLEELNEDEFLTEDEDPEEEEEGSGDGTEVQEPKAKRVLKKKKTKNQSEEEYENEASTDAGEGEDDLEEPTPGPSTSQKRTRKATTKAPRKPRKQNENATKKKSKAGAKPKPKAKATPKAPKAKKPAKPPGRRSKHITPEQAELLKKGSRTFYQCLHCEKQFKRKDYLDHHLLNHNGIHLHKCEYCERTFTMKAHLVDHRMTHTGEKRHQCQYCDRQFAKTCNYKRHLRLHLDQRPYICTWPGCQYRSGNRSDVFKHIRARHFRVPRYIKDQHDRNITDQRDARMYFQELQIDDPIQMAASLHQQMNQHLDDEGIEQDREMVEAEVPEDMDQAPEPMEDHNQLQQQPIDVDPNLAQLQNGGGVPLIEPIDILATLVPDMQ